MERIINKLQRSKTWKEQLRKTCRKNKLNIELVSYFTPLRFKTALQRFTHVHARKVDSHERWLENELKAFYWFCMALSSVEGTTLAQFGDQEWDLLHDIFHFKTRMSLRYETQKLTCEAKPQKLWGEDEEDIFRSIMLEEKEVSNRWNEKARQLYDRSNGLFLRSGKQCRQKWLNHLDPSKYHGQWNPQEDRNLISLLLNKGRKWSQLSRELDSRRTEHMVKNRYKTIIARQKKSYPNLKDQDQLLTLFMKNTQSYTQGKASEERVQSGQNGLGEDVVKEQDNEIDIKYENEGEQRQEDGEMDPEQSKDKFQMGSVRVHPALDLAQVYSPWVGMPATPIFSPNLGFFMNLTPNFSSFDNLLESNFYNPGKQQ